MASNGVCGPHGTDCPGPPATSSQAVAVQDWSFAAVVSAANPLQYLPVVGSIYRIATGDAAPVGMRTGVSAVVGVLTGGPIGLIGSILGSLVEHMFHVEDRIRTAVAADPGPISAPTAAAGGPATHAKAEADLGQIPAAAGSARVADAYRSANLLGAV